MTEVVDSYDMKAYSDRITRIRQIECDINILDAEIKEMQAKKRLLLKEKGDLHMKINKERLKVAEQLEPDWMSDDCFPWSADLQRLVKDIFRFNSLRPAQLEVINASMYGRNVFVVMKTGGGKSLCYQLPALLDGGLTLVISPLLSLIRDQVRSMNEIVPGCAESIAGKQEVAYQRAVYRLIDQLIGEESDCAKRSPSMRLLFVTPEKIEGSKLLMTHLQKAYKAGKLNRSVVDEAHCASQWGEWSP